LRAAVERIALAIGYKCTLPCREALLKLDLHTGCCIFPTACTQRAKAMRHPLPQRAVVHATIRVLQSSSPMRQAVRPVALKCPVQIVGEVSQGERDGQLPTAMFDILCCAKRGFVEFLLRLSRAGRVVNHRVSQGS
jgi:hypothetical protein